MILKILKIILGIIFGFMFLVLGIYCVKLADDENERKSK